MAARRVDVGGGEAEGLDRAVLRVDDDKLVDMMGGVEVELGVRLIVRGVEQRFG